MKAFFLSDIYLNCFNVKESNEGRGRGMAIECTNKRKCKGIGGGREGNSSTKFYVRNSETYV